MSAPDLLEDLAAALLDPCRPVPAGLVAWNGSDPTVRLDVYRNNVILSLREALAEGFPVTRALLGEDCFAAMAHAFIVAQPPRGPVLAEYGDGFPAFIAAFPPAAALPYLPDLARLERARVRAFHAADRDGLAPERIGARLAAPEALPGARLGLHPSLAVIESRHAVVSLWAAHQGQGRVAESDLRRAECALVLRAGDEVLVLPVSAAGAAFVGALAVGATLAEASAAGASRAPSFDPAEGLTPLIQQGAIVAWTLAGEPEP